MYEGRGENGRMVEGGRCFVSVEWESQVPLRIDRNDWEREERLPMLMADARGGAYILVSGDWEYGT